MKIVRNKARHAIASLRRETKVLKSVGHHRNIVGFIKLLEFKEFSVLVLDYAGGGTLWDYMKGKKKSSTVNYAASEVSAMKGLSKGETKDSILSEDKCK